MDKPKKKVPAQQSGIENLVKRVNRIKSLENEVIGLKRELLIESASGTSNQGLAAPSFLLLRTAGKTLAAPLANIEEVVEMPLLVDIPKPIPSIAGMVNYHGNLIAVIDVDELAGARSTETSISQVLVICTIENRCFALKVDEALEVVTVRREDITMTDTVLPGIIQSSGMLKLENNQTALVIDLMWIAVGSHLGSMLSQDAAKPLEQ